MYIYRQGHPRVRFIEVIPIRSSLPNPKPSRIPRGKAHGQGGRPNIHTLTDMYLAKFWMLVLLEYIRQLQIWKFRIDVIP